MEPPAELETLPANATFPAEERALTDSVILAPNFTIIGTNSFGTVSGSLIAGAWSFSNTFAAFDLRESHSARRHSHEVYQHVNGGAIQSTGTSYFPAGVTFGTKYVPLPGTYLER